jgi:NitT/TauT family transport system substrate-binding protein
MNRLNHILAAAAVSFLAVLPQQATAQDKIVYGIPGPATSAVANLTFAMELGFFADEKITVEMVPLAGSGIIIPQLLSGQIHISGASIDPLIVSRQPGKPNFPLKFVYNLNRNMVWELAVMKDSKYQSIADLKGTVIGVSSLAANNIPHQAMLRTAGVDLKSVTFQAVGIGVPAYEALRTKQVEVLGLWDVTHAAIEVNGGDIRRLPIPPEFRGRSSHGFEVSEKFLAEKPDLIARFGRAAAKGTVACAANHVGCIKAFWKRYPELKPKTGSEDAIIRREVKVMLARLDNQTYFAPGAKKQWGIFDEQDWRHLIGLLKEGGAITTDDIRLDTLYTNELVPEFNRFDEAEVIAKAKAYQ